jgi:hypothetical protein
MGTRNYRCESLKSYKINEAGQIHERKEESAGTFAMTAVGKSSQATSTRILPTDRKTRNKMIKKKMVDGSVVEAKMGK